jgi:uncharacterized protein (TIGR03000 family)
MNRFSLSFLVAVVIVCALPGVSPAQYWSAEGPATRHDNGYVDPWRGPVNSGAFFGSTGSPSAYQGYLPTFSRAVPPPLYYSNLQPLVPSSPYDLPALSTEEEQEEAAHTASIQVRVPTNAEIWFENQKTRQSGALRNFISPPLETGKTFTYDVHARWTDSSGKVIDQTKQVEVQAGKRSTADFTPELTKSKG